MRVLTAFHIRYKCEICGAMIKWKHNYTNHMRYAHGNRLLKCDLCSFTTKWRSNWLQHRKSVHQIVNPSSIGQEMSSTPPAISAAVNPSTTVNLADAVV